MFEHTEEANRQRRLQKHNQLFRLLAVEAGLIFLQCYMVAPLIPRLAGEFNVSEQKMGLIVPAYMLSYGIAALFYGLISDRFGRWPIIQISLILFITSTFLTVTAQSANQMIFWRLVTGLSSSGVIPLTFALIGDLFPFNKRGAKLGLIFAAMEGGMAAGSAGGALLVSFTGWEFLFVATSVMATLVLLGLRRYGALFDAPKAKKIPSLREIFERYGKILSEPRGFRTYLYVLWNGIYHGGVYTWLGVYMTQRYPQMDDVGIGLTILGYGIPGLIFSGIIGRAADRFGRCWIIPPGLIVAAFAGLAMIFEIPPTGTTIAILVLSLGYDLTQPLFVGIVSNLGSEQSLGQIMGLKVFALFIGFGLGSYLFGELLHFGFPATLMAFGGLQLLSGIAAIILFKNETPQPQTQEVKET